MVDADRAEFIDDDGDASAVFGGEDAVEQRSLPRAEKVGENRDGDSVVAVFGHALEILRRLFSKGNNEPAASQRCAVGLFHRKI